MIEEHGVDLVRLMVAAYAVSDAPVRAVMRDLLDTDERFALPDAPAEEEPAGSDLPTFGLVARPSGKAKPDPARAEVLEKRKANKAERKAAAARGAQGQGGGPGQPPRSTPRRQAHRQVGPALEPASVRVAIRGEVTPVRKLRRCSTA